MSNTKIYVTSDISLASFLRLKGVILLSASKDRFGYKFSFDDSADSCASLAVDFLNSEFPSYDTHSKNIRLLVKTLK
jgi:hypothetical protein